MNYYLIEHGSGNVQNIVFFIWLSLLAIVLQTAILPELLGAWNGYDLLVPVVLYIAIHRPFREGLVMTIILGLLMDALSVGPQGMFGAAYLAMFLIVKWGIQFLHVSNRLFLILVVTGGVLLENVIYIGTITISDKYHRVPHLLWLILGKQLVCALLTGMIVFLTIRRLHKAWCLWNKSRLKKKRQNGF